MWRCFVAPRLLIELKCLHWSLSCFRGFELIKPATLVARFIQHNGLFLVSSWFVISVGLVIPELPSFSNWFSLGNGHAPRYKCIFCTVSINQQDLSQFVPTVGYILSPFGMLAMSTADKTSTIKSFFSEKESARKDTNNVNNIECHSHPDNASRK